MFLDVAPDLLAQGEVLGQGSLDDLIEGLNIRGHSSRGEKQEIQTLTHGLKQLLHLHSPTWVEMHTGISECNISRLRYSRSTARGRCSPLAGRNPSVFLTFFITFSCPSAVNPFVFVKHVCMWLEHVSGGYKQASTFHEQACYLHQRGLLS